MSKAKKGYLNNILSDILAVILCLSPFMGSLLLTYYLLQQLTNVYLQILLAPVGIVCFFLFFVFIWRILLPRLRPGVHKVGLHKDFIAWWTHSLLTRSARMCGLHYLIHGIPFLRFLYWRALGAKIPYNITTSYKITMHDLPVLEIGAGTMLAEDTEVSGHLIRGDKILVAKVKIGENVFIGRNTYIGPRTRIGDSSWIGMGNYLTGEVLAPGSRIESLSKTQKTSATDSSTKS